ncbi:GNAT family N-acetyltransferase [Bacillus thuringiensis]|uniref:GNAT family N-acetyltransferase n=1 Tax=Bacillus thuringiensis TaxID=1428 RepID=UPI001482B48C|nr:GNAT family N-acetyltransferase [Bacillus thuringiensis]
MKIKQITSMEHLMSYQDDWNRILSINQNNNPFIEFVWIYQWLLYFRNSYDIQIYVVEYENQVIAFFPFTKQKKNLYEYIQFIGFNQANYMDIVAIEKWKDQAILTVLNKIMNQTKTVFILHGLLENKGTSQIFIRYCMEQGIPFHTSQTVAPYINFEKIENFNDFIKKKMKKHGGNRKENRLKELGNVAVYPLKQDQLEVMFQLHKKRWQMKMDTSGFTKDHTHAFYKSLSFIKNDVLETKLDGLFIENHLIAFFYGFVCRNRYVLYILSHDDDFGMFSPGRMLLHETIKDRYLNHVTYYDLSIGYEPYKLDWNTCTDRVNKVIFPGKGWVARIGFWSITFKEKLIQSCKKNWRLVHFKRNTIGKLKKYVQEFRFPHVKKIVRTIGSFFFQKHTYEICRMNRDHLHAPSTTNFQFLTLKDIYKYSALFQGDFKKIIKRLYQKHQMYSCIKNNQIANCFWVNKTDIQMDYLGIVEPLTKKSLYVYDWIFFDRNVIAELFKKHNNVESIYIAIPNHDKNKSFFYEQGFVKEYQITKMKILGFSFIKRRFFQ